MRALFFWQCWECARLSPSSRTRPKCRLRKHASSRASVLLRLLPLPAGHPPPPARRHRPSPAAQPQWYGPVAATVPRRRRHHHPRGRHHEVAAARTAFLNAYNAQVRATAGAAPAVPSFARPTALLQRFLPPQSSQSGPAPWQPPSRRTPRLRPQVADTPEVAAAKQEFFNTFQRQAAAAAPPSRNYF
nr:cuticle protein CP1499-like [Penaeus vannamei]